MTILILLVLVVLLWMAVLAPSAWRRLKERQGVGSIDNFHHQLQLLEHAGPKTVPPAYRLHTAVPGGAPAEPSASLPVHDTSRPKLVLLRPTDDAEAADLADDEGIHYERVGVLDRPEPECVPDVGADLPSFRREEARRRCTILLQCLSGIAVTTGLIGIFPKMHLAWVVTGLAGLAALSLFGLIAYAREIEAEHARRLARRAAPSPEEGERSPVRAEAAAGYPGAWDEDDLDDELPLPRVAAH